MQPDRLADEVGERMFPSTNWPKKKMPAVASTQILSSQNWKSAIPTESRSPTTEPT